MRVNCEVASTKITAWPQGVFKKKFSWERATDSSGGARLVTKEKGKVMPQEGETMSHREGRG